jgi:integrase
MASIIKQTDGRWRAMIRRMGWPAKSRIFDNKRDATLWASQVEAQMLGSASASTDYVNPLPTTTVAKLIASYMDNNEVGRSKVFVLNALQKHFEKISLAKLNAIHLREYIDKRIKDKISGVTLAGDLSALSAVLRWGKFVRRLNINADLAKDARTLLSVRKVNTRGMERSRELSDKELKQLIEYFNDKPIVKTDMVNVIQFALDTCMRLGEIVHLQVEDIDFKKKTAFIRDRKHPSEKTGNNQTIPLLGNSLSIAKAMAADRTEGQLFQHHSAVAIGAQFQRAVKRLKIKDLHFHDLRHTGITALFRQGLPIQLVALVSGHRDWKQLKRYVELGADDVHQFINKLNAKK